MIRLLFALAAVFWLTGCERARDWPEPSPALWEVSGEHGERAWLFGTIHALPDGVPWRTPTLEQAFAASDLLLVEIANIGDADAAAEAFEEFGQRQGLPSLSRRVGPADRPTLLALMDRVDMDDADFWNSETWAAALVLANAARENEPGNGVDRALLAAGKPAEGMETFVLQFSRFDRLSERQQRELLAGIAREAQKGQADERVEAWLTGDLAALQAQMADSFLSDPALRETLLLDRNRYFAARVVAAMEDGYEPFVAVGAAHMIGPEGLPALLAERGYTVRRIQ